MTQPTSWHVSTESCHFKSGIFFRFRLARDLRRKFCKKLCLETPAEQSTLMMKQHGKDENRTQRKTQFWRCHAIQTFSLDSRQNWYYPPFKLKKINFVDVQYQPTILDGLKWKSNLDISQNQEWNCWPTRASPPTPWFMWGLASLEQSSRNTLNVNKQFLSLWIRVLI